MSRGALFTLFAILILGGILWWAIGESDEFSRARFGDTEIEVENGELQESVTGNEEEPVGLQQDTGPGSVPQGMPDDRTVSDAEQPAP